MTIEQTRAPESRPASGAAGSTGHGARKPGAQDGAGASFMALLGALDASAQDLTPLGTTPGDDPLATGLALAAGKGKPDAVDKSRRDPKLGFGVDDTETEADDGTGAALLFAQAAVSVLPDAPVALVTTAADLAAQLAAALAQKPASPAAVPATDAQTGQDAAALAITNAANAANARPAAGQPGVAADGSDRRTSDAAADSRAQGKKGDLQDASAAAAGRASSRFGAMQVQAQASAQANAQLNAQASAHASAQSQAAQAAADANAAKVATQNFVGRLREPSADAVVLNAAGFAAGDVLPQRIQTRVQERLEEVRAGPVGVESPASRHALSADAPLPVATVQIDTGGSGMDDRMDAQMSYWLSQKNQSAELTLDTADGKSVEVSIALNGNEAQVAFRAETASTRELLGSAISQLQDSMGREGVLLANVTVDSFNARGQGDGSNGDDSARQGRQGQRRTMPLAEIGATAAARAGNAANGANGAGQVDLYV